MRNKLALSAASLVLFALPVLAENSGIRGTVREIGSGRSLAGASVAVMQSTKAAQAEIRFQDLVKEDGSYAISGVPAGTYALTVVYPTMKPEAKSGVIVEDGKDLVLDFQLGSY
jgi:hypothetical protein